MTKTKAQERAFVFPDALSCENSDCVVKNDLHAEINFNIYMEANGGAFLYSKTPRSIVNKYVDATKISIAGMTPMEEVKNYSSLEIQPEASAELNATETNATVEESAA